MIMTKLFLPRALVDLNSATLLSIIREGLTRESSPQFHFIERESNLEMSIALNALAEGGKRIGCNTGVVLPGFWNPP